MYLAAILKSCPEQEKESLKTPLPLPHLRRRNVGRKSKWLHKPCLLGVPKLRRNGYITSTISGGGGDCREKIEMATSPIPSRGPKNGEHFNQGEKSAFAAKKKITQLYNFWVLALTAKIHNLQHRRGCGERPGRVSHIWNRFAPPPPLIPLLAIALPSLAIRHDFWCTAPLVCLSHVFFSALSFPDQ